MTLERLSVPCSVRVTIGGEEENADNEKSGPDRRGRFSKHYWSEEKAHCHRDCDHRYYPRRMRVDDSRSGLSTSTCQTVQLAKEDRANNYLEEQ